MGLSLKRCVDAGPTRTYSNNDSGDDNPGESPEGDANSSVLGDVAPCHYAPAYLYAPTPGDGEVYSAGSH